MKPVMLTLLIGLLLSGCTGITSQPSRPNDAETLNFKPIPVAGESAKPITDHVLKGWLVSSEQHGLYWLSPEFDTLGYWPGHIGQSDWRWLNDRDIVITALDDNTTALILMTLDTFTGEFTPQLSLAAQTADRETVCLQQDRDNLFVFTTDARGLLTHHFIHTAQSEWYMETIRTLMVGPSLSSCSVADHTHTLFIAEEEVGVWRYSADSEGENTRTLDYFSSEPEIESVVALADGRYLTVATNEARIRLRGSVGYDYPVNPTWALKNVSAAFTTTGAYAAVYDEAHHTLQATNIPLQPQVNVSNQQTVMLTADAQTTPVNRFGDAADDPAFWIHPDTPQQSRILGTDKKYGLNVYSLDGALQQTLPVGKVNNVDVRQGVETASGVMDIAIASNRSSQSLSVFSIDRQGNVSLLNDLPTQLNDVYGLCMGLINGALHVVVNDTDGRFEQYIVSVENNLSSARLVAEFSLPSQPEGCVVDDNTGELYYGEESTGIWVRSLANPGFSAELIATTNENVSADIEGMSIYYYQSQRFLVVSSQGNSRFAVYALDSDASLLGTFGIGMNTEAGIDGVSETDGLAITAAALGPDYPMGMLVVQDGRNVLPASPQNFKIINGEKIAKFIKSKQ